jgi:heme-degrading monooxygenase HmoA
MSGFLVIWAFEIRPEFQKDFESAYSSSGDWALFFRRDAAYIKTELRQDMDNPLRYITLDYWESQAAYQAFKQAWQADYQALDERFEGWTESELLIGQFLTSL